MFSSFKSVILCKIALWFFLPDVSSDLLSFLSDLKVTLQGTRRIETMMKKIAVMYKRDSCFLILQKEQLVRKVARKTRSRHLSREGAGTNWYLKYTDFWKRYLSNFTLQPGMRIVIGFWIDFSASLNSFPFWSVSALESLPAVISLVITARCGNCWRQE